jgi:hypothetical protein
MNEVGMKWKLTLVGWSMCGVLGCLPDVVPPGAVDASGVDAASDARDLDTDLDATADASDAGADTADTPPECTDAPECAERGLSCGPEARQRLRCEENAQGCLELISEECPLGSLCEDGKCVGCDDSSCAAFEPDEIIACIPLPDDVEPQYSVCRRDEVTGCLEFLNERCDLDEECVPSGRFEDPCVEGSD